eukprot:17457-Heterococcus_DN1.PRE.2
MEVLRAIRQTAYMPLRIVVRRQHMTKVTAHCFNYFKHTDGCCCVMLPGTDDCSSWCWHATQLTQCW